MRQLFLSVIIQFHDQASISCFRLISFAGIKIRNMHLHIVTKGTDDFLFIQTVLEIDTLDGIYKDMVYDKKINRIFSLLPAKAATSSITVRMSRFLTAF